MSDPSVRTVRVWLRMSYLGTHFHGWAIQPGQRTVQGVVESALATVLRSPRRLPVVCAGRTDTGVHAIDQHLHVDVPESLWPGADSLQRKLNSFLPDDVRIVTAQVAPPGFDARFSVLWRQYRYTVDDAAVADPLTSHVRWHRARPLELELMNQLAEVLLGEHDFAALCRHRPDASTVRTVLKLRWDRTHDDTDNAEQSGSAAAPAVMTVRADAFCHSMVRSLVGLMVAVGDGSRSLEWATTVIAERRRRSEVVTAPAKGLILEQVAYAPDYAAQATRARRFRGVPADHPVP